MRKNLFILSILMLFCANLTSCNNIKNNNNNVNNKIAMQADITDVTVQEMATYLNTKKEHYPISDEFIEKYQQDDGGYIDNAFKAGLVVDKQLHSPNQKWHFFESWYYPSIEDGTLSYTDSAKSRIYSKLLCPELLLWIYEACEVSPIKVRAAYDVAIEAKINKTHISTMAKNMRNCVPWEDILNNINGVEVEPVQTYKVSLNEGEGFTVSGLRNEYQEGSEVLFTVNVNDSTKEINEVKVNDTIINKYSGNKYKFTMPNKDVVINVTLKDKEVENPNNPNPNFESSTYNIKYDLGTRKTAKLFDSTESLLNSFELSEGENIINSISEMSYIYGGAHGGRGETNWYIGDIIKFGTTSVTGYLVFDLNVEVNSIRITGYVSDASCKVQIGSTTYVCSDMNETTKEVVESNQTSTIEVSFDSTNSLRIETLNKKPFYITSIEFMNK